LKNWMSPPNNRVKRPSRHRGSPEAARRHRALLHRLLAREWSAPDQQEELEAHFRGMPDRYWLRVDLTTVRWHLELVRAFYRRLDTEGAEALTPVVRWRHFPDRDLTEVAVCTWDRPGLLARVAQAFARAGISILHAQVFRRADNIMLELFQVADRQFAFVPRERLLEEMVKTLRFLAAAEPEPPRPLAAVPIPSQRDAWVEFDVWSSPEYTVLMVEAVDRLGLLYVIFREINTAGLLVAQAVAMTGQDVAGDVFFLTDAAGRKVTDPAQLGALRQRLLQALTLPEV
jgi:[protein-PII] uridylyltransferase